MPKNHIITRREPGARGLEFELEFENPEGIKHSVGICVRKPLNRERNLLFLDEPLP